MEPLKLSSRRLLAGVVVVVVAGDLDVTVAGQVEEFVRQARRHPGDHLVFDLEELASLDGAGLQVLLDARAHAERHGAGVHLAAARPGTALLLAGSRLRLHETVESALHAALIGSLAASRPGLGGEDGIPATA
ncbi:STAS domain-containing protein [Actinomadura scrupuli]|uniref:STAS domain-containing protein n=1 Tax=Actinomadura scrupuli TaxID=559629 RepID=UPI003D979496